MHTDEHSAFTLIELLTVLGIVGLFFGVAGVVVRNQSPGVALESAQATLVSALTAARSAAASNQSRAMLVVNADPTSDRFLRGVQVAVESAPLSDHWHVTETGALLPPAVGIVPPNGQLAGASVAPAVGEAAWPPTRHSSLVLLPDDSVAPSPENPSGRYLGMQNAIAASGASAAESKIVLAAVRRTPDGVVFEHPAPVRGIVIGRYGTAILINDGSGFDY